MGSLYFLTAITLSDAFVKVNETKLRLS